MYFLLFVGGIVLLAMVLNLRQRVQIIEELLTRSGTEHPAEPINAAVPQSVYSPAPSAFEPSFQVAPVQGSLDLEKFISWIKEYLNQGGVFLVLGSTTILLTIFAAREIYGFFTPFSALSVMFLSTAFVAFVSVMYKSRSLAIASLVLAGIAPLLTDAPSTNYVQLFSYLFVVILGAIWIVALTGRRELTTVALLLIAVYSV